MCTFYLFAFWCWGLLAFYKSRALNVLVLGNQTATGLGVEVSKQSAILLGIAIGMSSLCCAVGGGLSFVGLVCPHLARRLTGLELQIPDWDYSFTGCGASGVFRYYFQNPADSK